MKVFRYLNTALHEDGLDVRITNPTLKHGRVDSLELNVAQALKLIEDLSRGVAGAIRSSGFDATR